MHVDFNSYFASVEQQANPHLRGKAVAIAGKAPSATAKNRATAVANSLLRSVVTTASREAKARGVKTGMATWEAKKLCPDLIVVPGDPQKYGDITERFLTVCKKHADTVEQFSTDEAFLDVTTAAKNYFGASMIALMIRRDLKAACGEVCTVSIGIAPNKLVAKLAGESIKPHGLTVVRPEEVEAFVRSRPLKDFCGLGRRMEKKLEAIGVTSIDTLRTIPRARLIELFKSYGAWLHDASQGVAHDPVDDTKHAPKSIGHSYTFPQDLRTPSDVRKNLFALTDRVGWRLRKQGLLATRVSVYIRYGDFTSDGGARLLGEPVTDGLDIGKNAWALLVQKIDYLRGVRLIGVSVSELRAATAPTPIFRKEQRMQQVMQALDNVQARYGTDAWRRATTAGVDLRERTSGFHYDHEAMSVNTP